MGKWREAANRGNLDGIEQNRIYKMVFAGVYPHYVAKVEKKGRTKAELDEVICWFTGYSSDQLSKQIEKRTTFEEFFATAPQLNPARSLITGSICGVKLDQIDDDLVRDVRYLDKLVDEIAKGRPMEKILRKG